MKPIMIPTDVRVPQQKSSMLIHLGNLIKKLMILLIILQKKVLKLLLFLSIQTDRNIIIIQLQSFMESI